MKLDGGVDLNYPITNALGDARDNPPALSYDMLLGYEQATFHHRQHREKFAARDTVSNNVIGSAGAETYIATIGVSTGFTVNTGVTGRDSDTETADWVYHNPSDTVTASNNPAQLQFNPAPTNAAGSNITAWVEIGYGCNINEVFQDRAVRVPGARLGGPDDRLVERHDSRDDERDDPSLQDRRLPPAGRCVLFQCL